MLGRLFGHAALAAPAAAVFSVGLVRVAEPNRGGGESESAATGESRSLASVLAGSSSYSFRGHQVALGDAAGAPTAAPAPAPAPHAGQKRNAMGTEVQRWADRLDRNVIAGQIAEGCKCGCVDTYATAGDIIAQRTLQQKKTGEQRRLFFARASPRTAGRREAHRRRAQLGRQERAGVREGLRAAARLHAGLDLQHHSRVCEGEGHARREMGARARQEGGGGQQKT